MEEKTIRNLLNKPKDIRISSLPVITNTNWFALDGSSKSNVVKKGWLEKQSRNIFAPWKSRWAVLTENGLACYENEFENKANCSHTLLLNKDVLEVNDNAVNNYDNFVIKNNNDNSNSNNKYIFKIFQTNDNKKSTSASSLSSSSSSAVSSKKVDTYATRSEKDRKEWVRCLRRVMFARIGGAIFGASISETLYYERRSNAGQMVPEIVEMCCNFLLQHGLQVEGLFRHSSRTSVVKVLRDQFDRGHRPSLVFPCEENNLVDNDKHANVKTTSNNNHKNTSNTINFPSNNATNISYLTSPNTSNTFPIHKTTTPFTTSHTTTSTSHTTSHTTPTTSNIHAVSSLLKAYLLELPEPIIPVSFYEAIMTIVTRYYNLEPQKSTKKIASIIKELPVNSFNLLSYLCMFLNLIGQHQCSNKMSHANLSKVFCNAVLQPEVDDPALLMGTADNRASALLILLTRLDDVFVEKYKIRRSAAGWEEEMRGGGKGLGLVGSDEDRLSNEEKRDLIEDGTLNKLLNFFPKFRNSPKESNEKQRLITIRNQQKTADQVGGGGDDDDAVRGVVRRRRRSEEKVATQGTRSTFKSRLSMLLGDKIEEHEDSNSYDGDGKNGNKYVKEKDEENGYDDDDDVEKDGGMKGDGVVCDEGLARLRRLERGVRRSSSLKELATEEKQLLLNSIYNQAFGVKAGADEDASYNITENGGHHCNSDVDIDKSVNNDGGDSNDDGDDAGKRFSTDVDNAYIVDCNNNLLSAIPTTNNHMKSHSVDELNSFDKSPKELPRSNGDLFNDVTNYFIKHGISLDMLDSSKDPHNKRNCIIDYGGKGGYRDLCFEYLKGGYRDLDYLDLMKRRNDLNDDHKELMMEALCSHHESLQRPQLVRLCHTLKELLACEHHRVMHLESQLKELEKN